MNYRLNGPMTWILALTSVYALVSCSAKSGNAHDPSPFATKGTSDSGGGNGVDGKMLESYIVDPAHLPAYQAHLQPLLANLKSPGPDSGLALDKAFKLKTWYIAPVTLETIDKDVLGVSFDTQQIALQTSNAIWISKKYFEAMTSEDQARVLLHEMLMNLYFLKFKSIGEVCQMIGNAGNDERDTDCKNSDTLQKFLPQEKLRPLNKGDYDNIRYVTGWIMANAVKPISEIELIKVLYSHDFDHRLFDPQNYASEPDHQGELKVTKEQIVTALKASELTGQMPEICEGATSGKKESCQLRFIQNANPDQSLSATTFSIHLQIKGEAPLSAQLLIDNSQTVLKRSESGHSDLYILGFTDWKQKFSVGDRLHSGYLLFKKDPMLPPEGLTLESVIFKQGVVIATDASQSMVCDQRTPQARQFGDEDMIIRRREGKELFTEKMMAATAPMINIGGGCPERPLK